MGFMKDMKNLKKLGDHHGGMPSWKQAMSDVRSVADDRGEAEVLKEGRPAKAIVKGFATPLPDDRFAMEVPIKVHPSDPSRVAVQWDAQQASIAAAGGDMAAVNAGLQQTYGGVADAAMREAMASPAAQSVP